MRYKLLVILSCLGIIVLIIGTKLINYDTKDTLEMTNDKREPSALYKDRAEHVSKTCGKYKREIANRYKQYWPKKNSKTDVVLINKDVGFLWCRVPKAASESWSGVFIKKW